MGCQSPPVDVPSTDNRRAIVAVGADNGSRTHRSFVDPSFSSRRPALPGRARVVTRSLRLVRERAAVTFARRRPSDCTGLSTMDKHRSRRSPATISRVRRLRPAQSAHPHQRDGRSAAIPATEEATIALLSDVLLGERDWTMAELRSLISLRESVRRGREGGAGGDDAVERAS
jgi:hypothetical protein